jgi:hypothetical protein
MIYLDCYWEINGLEDVHSRHLERKERVMINITWFRKRGENIRCGSRSDIHNKSKQ